MANDNNKHAQQLKQIDDLLAVINDSLAWPDKYHKDVNWRESMREDRRMLRRMRRAAVENCSAAAYGESQVGKSYLMSSLLGRDEHPLSIDNCGQRYNFVMDINPSGGNNNKEESTGVITRFTTRCANERMRDYVEVKLFSVADLVSLLTDGYYNDIKHKPESLYSPDEINNHLRDIPYMSMAGETVQTTLTRDDVKDICEYIHDYIGDRFGNLHYSNFEKVVCDHIHLVPPQAWPDVFGILWCNDPVFTDLFKQLLSEYSKIGYQSTVYVPFSAVLWRHGTILKVNWIDIVLGGDASVLEVPELQTKLDVFDGNGQVLCRDFSKASLSTLAEEAVLVVPADLATDERRFLTKMDLLDFPGARSRLGETEESYRLVIPEILRRGKVAYLFNNYSSTLRLSSVLLCHHNDQKNDSTIGGSIAQWINTNVGDTLEKRQATLAKTQGISPLFLIATKFNFELQYIDGKDTPGELANHWTRFSVVFREMLKSTSWYEKWTPGGAFRHIYPLRDFWWSRKQQIFKGSDPDDMYSREVAYNVPTAFPAFFDELRADFVKNPEIVLHFDNPAASWQEFATVGNDGSRAILRDINTISDHLTDVRYDKFQHEIDRIQASIRSKLMAYYVPEDDAQKNQRLRQIMREQRIMTSRAVGKNPEAFGYTINKLMIPGSVIRRVAFDIIVLHTEVPETTGPVVTFRTNAGIKPTDDQQTIIEKAADFLFCDTNPEEVDSLLREEMGFTLAELMSNETSLDTTVADLTARRILDAWGEFLDEHIREASDMLPYSDDLVLMFQTLAAKFGLKRIIADKITEYEQIFDDSDRPIAIADYASLLLNNLVSTVGMDYLDSEMVQLLRAKLEKLRVANSVTIPSAASHTAPEPQPLVTTLEALDRAANFNNIDEDVLKLLPFWDAFRKWQNNLILGLVLASDVSNVDVEANNYLKSLIDRVPAAAQ